MPAVERLRFDLTRVMTTRAKGDGPGTFVGHAAVFNKRAAIGDPKTWGFWEEIAPTAFDRALAEDQDVRFLVDHDPSRLLARTASGTLRLSTDRVGLATEADMPDTTLGRDTGIMLERGDLSQMSFGFIPKSMEWTVLDNGEELLRILDLDLFDVSVVTFPAYEETDAALRSKVEALRSQNPHARRRHQERQARFDKLRPPAA